MATFIATLLWVRPESNPEEANVPVEARTLTAAKKQAEELLEGELRGLGWRSYRDVDLWGKEQRVVVDVVTEEDHIRRCGQGNTRGSESQAEREARLKKAAK